MKFLGVVLTMLLFGACAHPNYPKESNVRITKDLEGGRWDNIYFSKQPSRSDINSIKDQGFKTIINLREKIEDNYDESWEKKLARKNNLYYYNIPFSIKTDMSYEYVDRVTSKIMKHRKEGKILIHCSTGNRVGIWLGAHLHKDHKASSDESLSLAKELGLTNPKAIEKLEAYLKHD